MTNEGEVYFALSGIDFDPDEVTKRLALTPTSVQRGTVPRPKLSRWKLSSGKIENDLIDVYEMSSALVVKLTPHVEEIRALKQHFQLEAILQVVLWVTPDDSVPTPAIGFEPAVIHFLHAVGASVDIDTYRNVP